MKQEIILIGGGGHCKACIDVIESQGRFAIAGLVDIKEKLHEKVLGYEVIARDDDLPRLAEEFGNFLITIGHMGNAEKRVERFEYLKTLGAKFPVIISPHACVAKTAFVDEGTIVMHKAVINSGARVGKNCIVNTAAIIEHDAIVENHCHISTGCIVNGTCKIGARTFAGSNASFVHNIEVADNTVIGTGAVITKSIKTSGTYVGNPARELTGNE